MAVVAASRPVSPVSRVLVVVLIAGVSLLTAATAALFQEWALGAAIYLSILVLALLRPRVGLSLLLAGLVALEPLGNDPISKAGALFQWDVSSWTPLHWVNFSPAEILLAATTLGVLGQVVVARQGLRSFQLRAPLLVFLGLMTASIAWGVARGGSLNFALWETRSLFAAGLIALLVPSIFRTREQIDSLMTLLCVATLVLSVDIIWRRFAVLPQTPTTVLDLAFDHSTPVLMNLTVVLLLARLIWPATKRQRAAALLVPLILVAEMVTERRAGWVGLDVALLLMALFVFRLRQRLFYVAILPMIFLYAGYLLAFWSGQGTIAQPARAVSSIVSPDPRDAASDLYRVLERTDIRMNMHDNPIAGLGFGRQYVFYVPLPSLSWWPFWHYESHNSILWLWMEMGPAGFTAFMTLLGAGIVRGVQVLRERTADRAAPVLVALVGYLMMLAVFSYVDLGLVTLRLTAPLGLTIGLIGVYSRLDGSAGRDT